MAPHAKRQKTIQTTADPSKSNSTMHHGLVCKHHGDKDKLNTTCNAYTAKKTRCGKKVHMDSTSNNSVFLPVCGIHRSSPKHRRGRCIALADCGEPCQRPCIASESLNHVCSVHRDAVFPCHINKLLPELRVMIFEYFIPPGPIARGKDYSIAAALVQVNKSFQTDAGSLLFRSTRRPLSLRLEDAAIVFRGTHYREELEKTKYSQIQYTPHLGLHNIGLHQFQHIDIAVVYKCSLDPRVDLERLLENILHVLSATKIITVSNQKGNTGPTSKTRQKSVRVVVDVQMFGSHRWNKLSADETFAVVNAIFEMLQMMDKARAMLDWTVNFTGYADITFKAGRLRMNRRAKDQAQELDLRLPILAQAFMFRRWLDYPSSRQQTYLRSWTTFLKYAGLCKDLIAAGVLDSIGRTQSGFTHTMHRALMNHDEAGLTRLLDQTWNIWVRHQATLERTIALFQQHYSDSSPSGDMDKYTRLISTSNNLLPDAKVDRWHSIDQEFPFFAYGADSHTECGVFRYRLIESVKYYQLVTPQTVRDEDQFLKLLEKEKQHIEEWRKNIWKNIWKHRPRSAEEEEGQNKEPVLQQTTLAWQKRGPSRRLVWGWPKEEGRRLERQGRDDAGEEEVRSEGQALQQTSLAWRRSGRERRLVWRKA